MRYKKNQQEITFWKISSMSGTELGIQYVCCIGLSLLMVMLLARNDLNTFYTELCRHPSHHNQGHSYGQTGLCGSYYDCQMPLSRLLGNFEEQILLLTGSGEHASGLRTTKRGRERQRDNMDLLLCLYQGWCCKALLFI